MRLRFSIRDLLWLTLVVALAVGWWLDHARLSQNDEEMLPIPSYKTEQLIYRQDSNGLWQKVPQNLLSRKR